MDWGKEKVLITGGGGFLGGWLLRSLCELGCCEIRSFGRTPRPDLEVNFKTLDNRIADACAVD